MPYFRNRRAATSGDHEIFWRVVMVVAIATTALRNIKALSLLGWLSELSYLPEVLYLVILFWLFLSGPGWFSTDHLILSKIGPE
jgi:hypothetical protein